MFVALSVKFDGGDEFARKKLCNMLKRKKPCVAQVCELNGPSVLIFLEKFGYFAHIAQSRQM